MRVVPGQLYCKDFKNPSLVLFSLSYTPLLSALSYLIQQQTITSIIIIIIIIITQLVTQHMSVQNQQSQKSSSFSEH